MQFHPCKGSKLINFTGWKLLLASESVGNVGQLAADLVIATLGLPLVGHLESQHLLPCAGVEAFGTDGTIHLPLDVMADVDRQLAIIQQRSPAINGCQGRFAGDLSIWLRDAGFKEVAYCGSIDGQLRQSAEQLDGSQLRVISGTSSGCKALQLTEMEPEVQQFLGARALLPPWQLMQKAPEQGVSIFALVRFATEGDNVADARELCNALLPWLPCQGVEIMDWQTPRSWECVYGQDRSSLAY